MVNIIKMLPYLFIFLDRVIANIHRDIGLDVWTR